MRRQTSKARRIFERRFQNSRCSTLSEEFVKSSWRTVRLTKILKNLTLKSVDGLLIAEDSGQFIRTSCQKKECYIHLDYMFDTKSETWISEMVRYSIFQHIFATSKLYASHCNNLYFESLPPKKLSQRTDIQIQSASQFMGKDTNIIKYVAYYMQHLCHWHMLVPPKRNIWCFTTSNIERSSEDWVNLR